MDQHHANKLADYKDPNGSVNIVCVFHGQSISQSINLSITTEPCCALFLEST
jgi:hypothetical protein